MDELFVGNHLLTGMRAQVHGGAGHVGGCADYRG